MTTISKKITKRKMAMFDPIKIGAKFKKNVLGSEDDMRDGLNAVTISPGVSSGKKIKKMRENWLKSMDSGTILARLNSVNVADWKAAALDAVQLWQARTSERGALKQTAFWQKYGPLIEAHVNAIAAMPDDTEAQREAKMLANLKGMKALKNKWR